MFFDLFDNSFERVYIVFVLGLFLVIGLTACGSNDKKDVLAHTETFLTVCKDGDFAKAEKLCSAEAANT